jgi:uncharacterized protein DUF2829
MNVHSACELAIERYRRVRRASWPEGRHLVYAEGAVITAGAMEGAVIGPVMYLQDRDVLSLWQPSLSDVMAMDWELVP